MTAPGSDASNELGGAASSSRVEVGVPNVATTATPTSTAIAPAAAVRESCSPRSRTATIMVIMGPVPRATA